MPARITVTTANDLNGYEVSEYLGIVRGIVVRAQTISQGIRGSLASIFGGNIVAYEEVCEKARSEAYARMVEHAQEKGADAIIAMRYDATEFAPGITEVLAYGTAVKLRHG
ncbi:MAG: YbjQ family protein [Gemmataceae bacterium]